MYNEIFSQITNAANKRNLRDSTIHAYCTSVAHFLKYTDKPIDTIFFCRFFQKVVKIIPLQQVSQNHLAELSLFHLPDNLLYSL